MRWVTLYADAVIKPRHFSNPQWLRFHLHWRRTEKGAMRTRAERLKIRLSAEIQGKELKYQNLEMPPAALPSTPYFLFEGFARVEAAEEEDEEWVAETGDGLPRDSLPITETSPLSRAFLPPSLQRNLCST